MSNNSAPLVNSYKEDFDRFLQNHSQQFRTPADKDFLVHVFSFSEEAHKNMYRYSGAPYITHPLEVAKIVTQHIGLGKTSVAAALLHDVPNKTEYTADDIERFFGTEIAGIVQNLTKIKNTEYFVNNKEASVFREILLTMSEDIRVIFIKIADKLHSMRTLKYLSLRKQDRTVNEVLNIYAPLAHRLGLFEIKSEMEDLCLQHTSPGIYKGILKKIKSNEREKLQTINQFLIPVKDKLEKTGIEYTIQSRTKPVYSIWKKIQQKRVPLREVYDLYAVRIIYKSGADIANQTALKIAELIRELYPEKTDRTRNWLEVPKETGYRAYHITVKSHQGVWVEVQIRSEEMHAAAEHGLAAHWRYKGINDRKNNLDEKVSEILESLKSGDISGEDFMNSLKQNILTNEIYVFTPKGKIISLPKQATVLDFAFKIHTKLGASALSAKVNGTVVPLYSRLNSGDRVEIIASEKIAAQKEWFNYVITHKALEGLKYIFREERQKQEDSGQKILENILENESVFDFAEATQSLMKRFKYSSLAEFYIAIDEERIRAKDIQKKIHANNNCVRARFWTVQIPDRTFKNRSTNLERIVPASCCKPTPEDDIIGAYCENGQIQIHKQNCCTLKQKNITQTTPANWSSYSSLAYYKKINIAGTVARATLNELSAVFTDCFSANLKSINWRVKKNEFSANVALFVKNNRVFEELLSRLWEIEEVKHIEDLTKEPTMQEKQLHNPTKRID